MIPIKKAQQGSVLVGLSFIHLFGWICIVKHEIRGWNTDYFPADLDMNGIVENGLYNSF
jgi:hypothetical protein